MMILPLRKSDRKKQKGRGLRIDTIAVLFLIYLLPVPALPFFRDHQIKQSTEQCDESSHSHEDVFIDTLDLLLNDIGKACDAHEKAEDFDHDLQYAFHNYLPTNEKSRMLFFDIYFTSGAKKVSTEKGPVFPKP